MRKTLAVLTLLSFTLYGRAQDAGYRTTDVGAAWQYTPDYNAFSLHLGFNAEEFHSIVLKGSYIKTKSKRTSSHDTETGSGWGAYLGYRYHFSVIPKRAFLGLGIGLQSMNISWTTSLLESDSRVTVLQPTLEAGYTLVINDYMYITPSVSGVLQTKLSTNGDAVDYGKGFLPGAGISIGWRF